MKRVEKIMIGALVVLLFVGYWHSLGKGSCYMLPKIITKDHVVQLFPRDVQGVIDCYDRATTSARFGIEAIIACQSTEMTFETIVLALDRVSARFGIMMSSLSALQMLSPDAKIRDACQESLIKAHDFYNDTIMYNKNLYSVIKKYSESGSDCLSLNPERRKYLQETLRDFETIGIALPDINYEEVKAIQKELSALELQFSVNIAQDVTSIKVSYEELAGVAQSFIESLKQDDSGYYNLGTDMPTVSEIMENCAFESTREKLWRIYNNKAHPVNYEVLKKIIDLRKKLAHKLGFASYAHMTINKLMAKTPEHVYEFLHSIEKRATDASSNELTLLKNNLPSGVTATQLGQIKPWDYKYIIAQYQKKHHAFNVQEVQEYFPASRTLRSMLEIYSQFLGVVFKEEPLTGLWHDDVRYVGVYKNDGNLIGHLLLDLHPRPYKYGHACASVKVPAVQDACGNYFPPVVLVIANFPQSTAKNPSLLKHSDVETLFHEFGHAVHMLLGATEMAGFSGTNVALDFVEIPSQMFEEWMFDAEMLKKVSSHYITGESLPDDLIKKIQENKRFGKGYFIQRQLSLALLSLNLFARNDIQDPLAVQQNIFKRMLPMIMYDNDNNFISSFGHLTGYGAGYYSYLWSKVYAMDMFGLIKRFGLLNQEIGVKYAHDILSKGGSIDPEDLIRNFLGRAVSTDAFFEDLGL